MYMTEKINTTIISINHLDDLSRQETPIHRRDPRAKVITTLIFTIAVISFGKYELSALLPFMIYPVVMMTIGNIPIRTLVNRMILVAPFAIFIGIFNPFFDHHPVHIVGQVAISGGWVSFASIMIRFFLTVSAALLLISVTGFNTVCMALEKLGTPRLFVMQLLFLYRYIFVLVDEAISLHRARLLRTFNKNGTGIKIYGNMAGHLLLHTLDRAQRIYLAMNCRGFDGTIRVMRTVKLNSTDIIFTLGWSALFVCMRLYDIPQLIGTMTLEYLL